MCSFFCHVLIITSCVKSCCNGSINKNDVVLKWIIECLKNRVHWTDKWPLLGTVILLLKFKLAIKSCTEKMVHRHCRQKKTVNIHTVLKFAVNKLVQWSPNSILRFTEPIHFKQINQKISISIFILPTMFSVEGNDFAHTQSHSCICSFLLKICAARLSTFQVNHKILMFQMDLSMHRPNHPKFRHNKAISWFCQNQQSKLHGSIWSINGK